MPSPARTLRSRVFLGSHAVSMLGDELATHVLSFASPVAVAASTLAAAALFNPLRRRVQRIVDRRFNRARYDAEKTIAGFAAQLKDAVDPDAVRVDLLDVVHRALEPTHASVWASQHEPQKKGG